MRKKLLIRCIFKESNFIDKNYNIIIKRKNKTIFNGFTDRNGFIEVEVYSGRKYEIFAINYNKKIKIFIKSEVTISECYFNNLYFIFINKKLSPAKFNVTDKFYSGLPVAKGELILCHNI